MELESLNEGAELERGNEGQDGWMELEGNPAAVGCKLEDESWNYGGRDMKG